MAIEYNFKYMPLVGKLSGKSMAEQTETAINEIAKIVNDNTAQAEIINTLAEEANANSVEALEKANEALETSGRVYIKETGAVDLDSYCESQLIYINNISSQNLPVESKGFLEVKTNDDKTQATQVFIDDTNKEVYTRSGAITETTVGDVTTYTASYSAWNKAASTNYVENMVLIRQNSTAYSIDDIARSTSLASYMLLECTSAGTTGASEPSFAGVSVGGTVTDGTVVWTVKTLGVTEGFVEYLPLAGGTLTGTLNGTDANFSGDMTVAGVITGNVTGNLTGNADTATNAGAAVKATKDGDGNVITVTYLPILNNAGYHNSIYRGKYLGDYVTEDQWLAIHSGAFTDMYIGDYWTINGINWRIGAFDYWYRCGDTECTTHHVLIVPDTNLATCKMNDTNITTGAYIGSDFYTGANSNTGRSSAQTAINNAFGSAHILTHREYLQNAVTDGHQSAGAWYDSTFELMNEHMVYGGKFFENACTGGTVPNIYSIDKSQLPLFAHEPSRITNRAVWWLRSVVSAAGFAHVSTGGCAYSGGASSSLGVRPAFAIKA